MTHLHDDVVAALVERSLPPAAAIQARDHVADCAECRTKVADYARAAAAAAPPAGRATLEGIGAETPRAHAAAADPSMTTLPSVLLPGQRIGRYVLVGPAGRGAMGEVHEALDTHLKRRVALKVIKTGGDDGSLAERLRREALALARLSHPNVGAIYDTVVIGSRTALALEFVEGQNLRAWMDEGAHGWRATLAVLLQAGRGLEAAHAAGVVHRDFKPSNAIVGRDGRVRVVDFGLAKTMADARRSAPSSVAGLVMSGSEAAGKLTAPGAAVGTPRYMSPEQILENPLDARTDQFSFCVVLYEALCGVLPFDGATPLEVVGAMMAGKVRTAPRGRRVPPWLLAIVQRGLAPDREQRWADMTDLLAAIERGLVRHRRRLFLGAGAATVAAVLVVAFAMRGPRDRSPLCGGGASLDGVWDDGVRTAVAAAFARSDAGAATTLPTVTGVLDAYAGAWTALQRSVCGAADNESPAYVGEITSCALDRLFELGLVTSALRDADAAMVSTAPQLVDGLTPISDCEHLARERQRAVTLATAREAPSARARARERRSQILRLGNQGRAGRCREVLAETEAVLPEARGWNDGGALAELLLVRGSCLLTTGRAPESRVTFQEALWHAEAGGHDILAARLWAYLAMEHAYSADRHDRGPELIDRATAALERGRAPDWVRVEVLRRAAAVWQAAGRFDKAHEASREASRLAARSLPAESLRRSQVDEGLVSSLRSRGQLREAKVLAQAVLDLRRQRLGPRHPMTHGAVTALAEVHMSSHEFAEARALLQDLVDQGPTPSLPYTMARLAEATYDAGDVAKADALLARALAALPDPGADVRAVDVYELAARLHTEGGRPERALQSLAREEVFFPAGGKSALEADMRRVRAEALWAMGRVDEALADTRRALDIFALTPGFFPEENLRCLARLHAIQCAQKAPEATLEATRAAARAHLQALDPAPPALTRLMDGLAACPAEGPPPIKKAERSRRDKSKHRSRHGRT